MRSPLADFPKGIIFSIYDLKKIQMFSLEGKYGGLVEQEVTAPFFPCL